MDSSSTAQLHHQETVESMVQSSQEKKARPGEQEAQKCPRCESSNTKFCYYNNYSLSQPRYFCKSCRRYWTKGGTLRNVPVGGGCRRNKRSSKRSQDPSSDLNLPITSDRQFPIWGNPHHQIGMGSEPNSTSSGGLFDAIFPENPSSSNVGFQSLLYGGGMGMGIGEEIGGNGIDSYQHEEAVKQGEENRVLWGFPWQEVDSGRFSWNGIGSSSSSSNWQGLLNSPLI